MLGSHGTGRMGVAGGKRGTAGGGSIPSGTAGQPIGLLLALTQAS